jgi:hypothetical protein
MDDMSSTPLIKKKNMVRSIGLASGPHSPSLLLARGQLFARFFFSLDFFILQKNINWTYLFFGFDMISKDYYKFLFLF